MTEDASNAAVGSGEDVPAVSKTPVLDRGKVLKPTDLRIVQLFLLVLGALLMGYAFLGRGFAHLGVPPVYLGEMVLALGLVATATAAVRSRLQISRSWLVSRVRKVRRKPCCSNSDNFSLRESILIAF